MLLLALWSVAAATGESPVAKVVAVLAELKAKTANFFLTFILISG